MLHQDLKDGILELVIDNPPVNALTIGLLRDLWKTLDDISINPDVRVVIIRAAGRGFCAGGDVKEVEALAGFGGILGQAAGSAGTISIARCAVPVICAIHNYCVGLGVLIAGMADIIVAAQGTRFVLAEVDNGATAGGVQALKLMPEKRVRYAMMTAQPIFAEELFGYGSIAKITPAAALVDAARGIAMEICAKSPATMRRLKTSLNGVTGVGELEARYRSELSYTYELNIMGVASEGRSDFIAGKRESYVPGG